jgi:D-sedoheptulose 7-phosphate isomerase
MAGNQREQLKNLATGVFRESVRVKNDLCDTAADRIPEMAELLAEAFRKQRCLFIFGNGGSAADAQHLTAEFVNRFRLDRPPLPAVALTVDSSILTSIGNDFSFQDIFLKQLQALAKPGDVALGISTSGRSENVLKALQWAREHGVNTLGWSGQEVTAMDDHCDVIIHVPSRETPRIQEAHIVVGHILCELVEHILFGDCGI